MKRIFFFFAVSLWLSLLTLTAQEIRVTPKALVVYYSRTGHTKTVALALAKKFNADLEELTDLKKRTGLFAVSIAGKDAIAHNLTQLDTLTHNLADYDIILLGTPSWFGNTTPAARTFVLKNKFDGKYVAVFGVCHVSGVEHALKELSEILSPGHGSAIVSLPLREHELNEEILKKKIDEFYNKVMNSRK